MKAGIDLSTRRTEILYAIPFDSTRKLMSVVVCNCQDKVLYSKGAPEVLLAKCNQVHREGRIEALTDAPAVKAADIGIAMGVAGTDVTKEASDMVLTDDNFASIVSAVEEGRGIFDDIQRVLQFLLSCNFGGILLMLVASLIGWPAPLLPIQLLWINLVTDGLPALALSLELAIPVSAVLDTRRRQIAYRLTQQGAYELVELKLGSRAQAVDDAGQQRDYYLVVDGLKENDRVVVQSGFLLDSQRQIEGMPSFLSPTGQSASMSDHAGHTGHGGMSTNAGSASPTLPPITSSPGHQH